MVELEPVNVCCDINDKYAIAMSHSAIFIVSSKYIQYINVGFLLFCLKYIFAWLERCTTWKVLVFWVFLALIFPHSDQKNSEYGHFLRSVVLRHRRIWDSVKYLWWRWFAEIVNSFNLANIFDQISSLK